MITIRPATPADAAGIAGVHVDTWRTTYQGIVSDAFLAGLSYEQRRLMWQGVIAGPAPRSHLVVATGPDGAVVGFSSAGVNRAANYAVASELYAIYVRREWQGQGTGRQLFLASVDRLRQQGFASMMLWALQANPACRFYERAGGTILGNKLEEIGGRPLTEVAYGWPDLAKIGGASG